MLQLKIKELRKELRKRTKVIKNRILRDIKNVFEHGVIRNISKFFKK